MFHISPLMSSVVFKPFIWVRVLREICNYIFYTNVDDHCLFKWSNGYSLDQGPRPFCLSVGGPEPSPLDVDHSPVCPPQPHTDTHSLYLIHYRCSPLDTLCLDPPSPFRSSLSIS